MIQIEVYERKLTSEEIVNRFKNEDNEIFQSKEKRQIVFDNIKRFDSRLLTSYVDYIEYEDYILLIRENYGKSLDIIMTEKMMILSMKDISKIAYQLLNAVDYLEKKRFALRSLIPQRIFIDDNMNIKLGNYATDLLFTSTELQYQQMINYLAPELIFSPLRDQVNSTVIWSIGMILLELLTNSDKSSFAIDYYKTKGKEFISDYMKILSDNKNTSLFTKNKNEVILFEDSPSKDLLSCYFNGRYLNKDNANEDLIELLYECLIVDCDKRKKAEELLQHPFFKKMNNGIEVLKDSKQMIVILPIHKEDLIKKINEMNIESKLYTLNYKDNYEIATRICKMDLIKLLKHKGILQYDSKLLSIPVYCPLNNTINKDTSNTNHYSLSFNSDLCESLSGHLLTIASYNMSFPSDYSNNDQMLFFLKENAQSIPMDKIKTEINNYFKIKYLIGNIIYQLNDMKKEDLVSEIKKNNYYIPSTYRMLAYSILLDIDYFNNREFIDFALSLPLSVNQEEFSQITKDLDRCGEFNLLFKSDDYKIFFKKIFLALLLNDEFFFYVQGMDSILISMASICNYDLDMTYSLFYKLIYKILFQFYDEQTHSVKDLHFHHLIFKRLLAYYDPQLYTYLLHEDFFEIQYGTNWLLSLFSRSFKSDNLFQLWDILLIENGNIIYIIIVSILLSLKETIMDLSVDDILLDLNNLESIDYEVMIANTLGMYRTIPQSLIPLCHEFNLELVNELKQNEFLQNRWWDLCDFYIDEIRINVPIITLEDVIKAYSKIFFVDIRPKELWDKCHVKDSINYDYQSTDQGSIGLKAIEKILNSQQYKDNNKMLILLGDQSSDYTEVIYTLLIKNIAYIAVLQGGIDIIQVDEESLISMK